MRKKILNLFILLSFIVSSSLGQISFGEGGRAISDGNPSQQQLSQGGGGGEGILFEESPPSVSDPSCQTPDQKQGSCKALAQCAIFFAEIPQLLENPCQTKESGEGVCCPNSQQQQQSQGGSDGVIRSPPTPRLSIPRIDSNQLEVIVEKGNQKFKEREQKVNVILFEERVTIEKGSPAESHQKFFTTTNQVLEAGKDAQLNLEVTQNLIDDLKLTKDQGTFGLPSISNRNTKISGTCPPQSRCRNNFPYRTIDGSCNNIKNPDWGKAQTQLQRILQPTYGDGVNTPRVSSEGRELPSPRLLSSSLVPDNNRPYNNYTLMLMQWGQFVDHDLTHTPIVKGRNQTSISCCSRGQHLERDLRHFDCFPIDIPRNDKFFNQHQQRCMEFVRSLPAPRRECNFGPREQMNQITAWLDGSMIYGSSDTTANNLRERNGGRLRVQNNRGKGLLPSNPSECSDNQRRRFCFLAGDLRVNEQLELALMHTIWMREHNRVADILQRMNPGWSDEIIYQEARRIIVAELQHIIYNEYLPLILGPEFMRSFNMLPGQGFSNSYNENIDASITNAFATAAFRFGHTLVQGTIMGFNQFGTVNQRVPFVSTQFSPFQLYDDLDSFVRGLATQESQQFDNFVAEALTNHLFQGSSSRFGMDLVSLNIQRGRDHGIPSYNEWREICGLQRLNNWNEFSSIMEPRMVNSLRSLYSSVDDIDLFIGGILERPHSGAIVGPTFVCIIGDQFARLRKGDRFFYEERTARFTEAQLGEIKKVSLARVLCDNSDNIAVIQPLVFQKASLLNRRLTCNSDAIPSINFNFWRERGGRGPPFNQNRPGGGRRP